MPVIYGNVAGRQHDPDPVSRRWARCRGYLPAEMWEQLLVWEWRDRGVSVESMANRLMRPVGQVAEMAARPSARRSDG